MPTRDLNKMDWTPAYWSSAFSPVEDLVMSKDEYGFLRGIFGIDCCADSTSEASKYIGQLTVYKQRFQCQMPIPLRKQLLIELAKKQSCILTN